MSRMLQSELNPGEWTVHGDKRCQGQLGWSTNSRKKAERQEISHTFWEASLAGDVKYRIYVFKIGDKSQELK